MLNTSSMINYGKLSVSAGRQYQAGALPVSYSKASLNIFWSQVLYELFVERLHFRLSDLDFAQLQAEICGSFLSAGLRQYSCCKEPTQQQSDKHSNYKASHFHTPSVIFSPYKIPIPVSRMDQDGRNNYQYKNLATALLHELF